MLKTGAVILFYTLVFMIGCVFAGYGVSQGLDAVFVAALFVAGAVGSLVVAAIGLIALIMLVEAVERIGE